METITPQVICSIFGLPISSTIIHTWFCIALIILIIILLNKIKPILLDMLVEFLINLISDLMGIDHVEQYLPFLGTLAIFMTLANNLGLLPIINSPTSDINTPIALSIIVFFSVHFYGIKNKGVLGYMKDLASPIFLLPLEIIGQFSRTLSLSLRLFGNILGTDLIVAIITSIVPFFAPMPMMALSMLTGVLQAYIFTSLAAVYITSGLDLKETHGKRLLNNEAQK